ncbi:hypothetical protein PENSPDRAFT_694820 [Peniophora sp. CONT]|nr:hypothetical protein PENSPDRAFT_694820 [Peniophora sp. CONT]
MIDPTYPLYPIASILSAIGLLLVLLTSFVRQSWKLGVALLCFWLFLDNLTTAINAIIWSDNADVKLLVYCDIVSHLQVITFAVKPMATLIITRRLYLIASLQPVLIPDHAEVEWSLGLAIPMLVAGPLYYVNQSARFEVVTGFGCLNARKPSIVEIPTLQSWSITPPLVSIVAYYPRVIRIFYSQSSDRDVFLRSNNSDSISRTNYIHILALASIDTLLTLPTGIATIALTVTDGELALHDLPFYPGWTSLHSEWDPVSIDRTELEALGTSYMIRVYFSS